MLNPNLLSSTDSWGNFLTDGARVSGERKRTVKIIIIRVEWEIEFNVEEYKVLGKANKSSNQNHKIAR